MHYNILYVSDYISQKFLEPSCLTLVLSTDQTGCWILGQEWEVVASIGPSYYEPRTTPGRKYYFIASWTNRQLTGPPVYNCLALKSILLKETGLINVWIKIWIKTLNFKRRKYV